MAASELLEKLVLGEVAGKHAAIHAYDRMMWTVRSGFLTLYGAAWGLLLQAMFDKLAVAPHELTHRILLAMLLVSIVLGIGGFLIDQNYARRKFRVIYSVDRLTRVIVEHRGDIAPGIAAAAPELQISGDKGDRNYLEVSGYRREAFVGRVIFLLPLVTAGIAVCVLWA